MLGAWPLELPPAVEGRFVAEMPAFHEEAYIRGVERDIEARGQDAIIVYGDSIVGMAPLPTKACGTAVVNSGIGGADAGRLISLLETTAAIPVHPRQIIIAVGVNDAAIKLWDEATFSITYEALVRRAKSMAPTIVATVAPIDTGMEVGMRLNASARDRINQTIIATAAKLSLSVIRLDDLPWRTSDGIHPEHASYDGWVARLIGAMCRSS
jgi:lysophospholipase L1-like esterase